MKAKKFVKVAIFLSLISWTAVAFSQAPVRLKMGHMKIAEMSPLFLGVDKGFFKAEGLELDLTPMVGGAAVAPALASGALHIGTGLNPVTAAVAHTKGFDFKFIAPVALYKAKTNDVFGIQVLRDSPIRTAKDLEGKVIASNTLQNTVHLATLFWIDKHGGDSSKVKVVEMPFPAMEGALRERKIDAFTASEPFITVPTARTTRVLGYPLGEIAPRLLAGAYFTSSEYIEKNPEKVRALIRGFQKGVDYHNANLEEARATIAKWTGLDPALVAKINMPAFEKEIVLSDIQPWIDLAYKYRFIDRLFKAEELIGKLAAVKR